MFDDITGHRVSLPTPAKRIVLAEGRQIVALAVIHPDPVSLLAGWQGDLRRSDRTTYALYRKKFPAIDTVPVLGSGGETTFSVERAIAVKPDVVVLGLGFAPGGHSSDIARQLTAAGITVVFTDFFVDPFDHMLPSLRILGQVIGRETQANAFAAFYTAHMDRIAARLKIRLTRAPTVLVEAHAGMGECCFAPGRKNLGDYIAFAGGDSISADRVPGPTGQLNLEYIVARDPQVYVATGGSHLEATGGLVIGPGYDAATIRARLAALAARPGIAEISAVRWHRVHGLFHNLIATPLNIVAVEALAKWINPDLFRDVDPAATIADLNARFLAVPMQGIYLIDLD